MCPTMDILSLLYEQTLIPAKMLLYTHIYFLDRDHNKTRFFYTNRKTKQSKANKKIDISIQRQKIRLNKTTYTYAYYKAIQTGKRKLN